MKAVSVKRWFKWFRHSRRGRDCTVGGGQSRVKGGGLSAQGDLRPLKIPAGWALAEERPERRSMLGSGQC